MAASGSSGGALPPRPTAPQRRRAFVAPQRQSASIPPTVNLPRLQEAPYLGSGSGRMPSPGIGGGSGLSLRFPNEQPQLGPRALTFTEPQAATWDAGSTKTSPAHVYEVPGDDYSPNHWMSDYSQPRDSSPAGSGYFTNLMEVGDGLELLRQQDATPSTGSKSKRGSTVTATF